MADNFFEPEVTESILPDDDTPSLGSNYGLDGYQFDSEYGSGVLERARLPEARGLSALPDGIVHTASPYDFATGVMLGEPEGSYHGTNLSEMLEENSLVGLGWLNGVQDPDRLPKNPVDRSIMELEKAWGIHDRTTGLLIPNEVYRAPDNDPHHEGFERIEADDMIKLVRQAMRRSSYGHPLTDILKATAASLKPSAREQIAGEMQRLAADHGLRGKVFITAADFPGLKNGKYAGEIHRYCSSARYVVVSKSMDAMTRDRIASVTGKVPVTTVPWKEAFDFYAPRLRSTGHRVASVGDYRARLKQTLASKERVTHETALPVQKFAVDQISVQEAKRKFASLAPEKVAAPEFSTKKAKQQIVRWVNAGLLTETQAVRLHNTSKSAHEMVLAAAEMISEQARRTATYEGDGVGRDQVLASRERTLAPLVDTDTVRLAKAKQAASQQLGRWIKQGFLTTRKAKEILSSKMSPRDMVRTAAELVADAAQQAGLSPRDIDRSKLAAVSLYSGEGEGKAHQVLTQKERAVAAAVNPTTLRQAKWLLQQMNEGWAGKNLSALIRKKFANKTASTAVANLRKEHEGLAGFIYVAASAYASDKGSKGCEEGALQHRANGLRYVLAMDRCASCVFATEGKCQKYNKTLLASSEGLEKIQRKNIKASDMGDAEATGSLFAPTYQDDYSLQYDDTIEVEDELPSEVLDGVLMDGAATIDNGGEVYEGIDFDEAGF